MTVATLPWASTLFPGSWEAQARLSPFRGEELWERALPFSVISVLAEASILLPPGPQSTAGAALSLGLLLVVAGAFALPWERLPTWSSVLVPIIYTASMLALVLATKSAVSRLGPVLLVPVVWMACSTAAGNQPGSCVPWWRCDRLVLHPCGFIERRRHPKAHFVGSGWSGDLGKHSRLARAIPESGNQIVAA